MARTGTDYVGLRVPEGLIQVEIATLPNGFLKSWNISRDLPKDNSPKGDQEHLAKSYDLVKVQYRDDAIGGIMKYSLTLVPESHALTFNASSEQKMRADKLPAYMVDLSIKDSMVDSMLAVIEKFGALLNMGSSKPVLLGSVGGNIFYFAASGVLTQEKREMPNHEWAGYMMRFDQGDLAAIPYLYPDEVEMYRSLLVRYKAGEFNSLIGPP